jgi:hypothetical protein
MERINRTMKTEPVISKEDNTPKLGKPGRKPKTTATSSDRFFIGEVKDGIPVLQKEVSLEEAFDNCLKTGRPFLSVELWKTKSELDSDKRYITVKTPA